MKKTYPLTSIGYAQFLLDIKQRKERRVSLILSTVVLLTLLGFGHISKPFLIVYLVNMGATELAHSLL